MSGYVKGVVIAGATSGVGRTAVTEAFSLHFCMCASPAGRAWLGGSWRSADEGGLGDRTFSGRDCV